MAEKKQVQKKAIDEEKTPQKEVVVSDKDKKTISGKTDKKEDKSIEIEKAVKKAEKKADFNKNEEREAEDNIKNFKLEESSLKINKTASKDTSGKFVQKKKNRKIRRQIQKGQAYVSATYNNTIVTLSDLHGNVLAWSSAGYLGFKGAKKATTYAAAQVVLDVTEKVQKYGLKDLDVFVKGVGSGRESAIRTLAQKGFNLNLIKDRTPIPHNGCRPRKPRRV